MAIRNLPDVYALSPRASGIHIREIPHGHVTTITCDTFTPQTNPQGYISHVSLVYTKDTSKGRLKSSNE